MRRARLILCVTLLIATGRALGVDPALDWHSFETENFYVHFATGDQAYAERAAAIAERAHARLSQELGWTPLDKTHLVLSDEMDAANGFATPLYFNRSVLYLAPPTSVNGVEDFDDWLTTLIVHEYTHILHLDKASGWPDDVRSVLGRFALLFPNAYQPAWITEGLATWKETDFERGIGRGQSSMYSMMMRAEVLNGIKPASQVNLPMRTWPAGTTRYLYGVYFMRFVAETYGEKSLQQLIEAYSDNLLPFFVNTAFREVFGKDVDEMWAEFDAWLRAYYAPQVAAIRARGLKTGVRLSEAAYRSGSMDAISTEGGDELYYVRSSGYDPVRLMRIRDGGETESLAELNTVGSLDAHPRHGVLISQDEFCNEYTIYRDLYRYDPAADSMRRLTECGRYLRAAWTPQGGIIALHHEGARFELRLLDASAGVERVLWQTDEAIVGQIDLSPDGQRLVASVWRPRRGWNIELFTLSDRTWEPLTQDSDIAAYPRFTPRGDAVLFSSEIDGVYNLVRHDLYSGAAEQLTNELNGAFQSAQARDDGPIYYAGYSAEGSAVYRLHDTAAVAQLPRQTRPLQAYDYAPAPATAADYDPWQSLHPRWWFPIINFTSDRSELGLTTAGSDALAIHHYALAASRDFELDAFAGSAAYTYADRFNISLSRNNDVNKLSDGTFERTRVTDRVGAVYAIPRTRILRQSSFLLSAFYDAESDGELGPGAAPEPELTDSKLGAAWLYNSSQVHPLSISPSDGMLLRLVAEDSDTLSSDFSGQVYTLDWKPYIRTGRESVLAFRLLQGWGSDRPSPFKLGGESNNINIVGLLDVTGPGLFDRRDYPLRGYAEGLPQLRGRRAQLLSAEWRFPIQRNERGIMAPPVGLMQWSGAVFAETGTAYRDSPRTYYSSAGLEINADTSLFYGVGLRLRMGYAHGFDDVIGEDRFYLQLGSSF